MRSPLPEPDEAASPYSSGMRSPLPDVDDDLERYHPPTDIIEDDISMDEPPQFDVSFLEISYNIIASSSQRGTKKLMDNVGYSYTV